MRILCIDANYPGRLGLLAGYLAARGHETLFASRHSRKDFSLRGVRRVILKSGEQKPTRGQSACGQIWRRVLASADAALAPLSVLDTEFRPDMVLSTSMDGATFFAAQAFPQACHIFYAAFGGFCRGPERQAMASIQTVRVLHSYKSFVFTENEKSYFPPQIQPMLEYVRPWADTALTDPALARMYRPQGCQGEWLSLRLRDLDPEQTRAARRLALTVLVLRPECHILLDCDEKAAWIWRLPEALRCRIELGEWQNPVQRRDILHSAPLHIIPGGASETFMARLEAMSCGALIMAPPPVDMPDDTPEIPGWNMLALPRGNVQKQARAVLDALDRRQDYARLRERARAAVCETFSPQKVLPDHARRILEYHETFRRG